MLETSIPNSSDTDSPETSASAGLSLKVPPPAYLLLGASLIFLTSRRQSSRPRWRWLGLPLLGLGLSLDLFALRRFHQHKTTVNPMRPEKAANLVSEGPYRFTRNPMYLGMALLLSGWSIMRTSLSGLLVVPAFVWTITQVQIKPEEKILSEKFGEPYLAYLKQVRRWL